MPVPCAESAEKRPWRCQWWDHHDLWDMALTLPTEGGAQKVGARRTVRKNNMTWRGDMLLAAVIVAVLLSLVSMVVTPVAGASGPAAQVMVYEMPPYTSYAHTPGALVPMRLVGTRSSSSGKRCAPHLSTWP